MTATVQAVADRAASYSPVRALLAVVSAPFFLAGIILAVLWVALTWCYAAAATGFFAARDQAMNGKRTTTGEGAEQ